MDSSDTAQAPWRRYPYQLVPGDAQLDFPAAEGAHPDYESDTWYLAGTLTGEKSGRQFAFITIFNRNRPGGEVVADFHTFALFDIDNGTYGTFTDYDMPPKNSEPGARPVQQHHRPRFRSPRRWQSSGSGRPDGQADRDPSRSRGRPHLLPAIPHHAEGRRQGARQVRMIAPSLIEYAPHG